MNNFLKTNIKEKMKKEELKLIDLADIDNLTINSNTFDIKNYLNFCEKYKPEKNKNKNSFNKLNSVSKFSTFDSKFKPVNFSSEGIATSTNYKTSSMNKNFGKGLKWKKNLNIMTSTYIGNNNNKLKNTSLSNFPYTKSTSNFSYNRNNLYKYSPTQTNESFNVFKVVKEIKKSYQFPKIINNQKQNKKILIRNIYPENIEKMPIAYKDKYLPSVY